MKDFPVFPTSHGAASLTLKEIPYRREAYIKIQSTQEPELLLEECIGFCTACGAERIYASGHDFLGQFPLHTSVCQMKGCLFLSEEEIPSMFPVTEATISKWREIYNDKMQRVDNASTLEARDESEILRSGGAYFVHRSGELLGIGWLVEDKLAAMAAVKPGAGEMVCKAMQSLIPQQTITLEVASTNQKAIRLYERLGFLKTEELSRWYRVK
ncbi:MAG: GNAT family N-acetyltransferase [Candidatus Faecousia sp.]|nr:GNAT family N-acetyltransferase [Bacillota bacterium]MDY4755410.1 GNAT family N-acetyltransferase [Candidatus Faecousia sp.]MDY6161473.1 GNAT family N-acetyltransferase [Candidatus Faecousia sp.]